MLLESLDGFSLLAVLRVERWRLVTWVLCRSNLGGLFRRFFSQRSRLLCVISIFPWKIFYFDLGVVKMANGSGNAGGYLFADEELGEISGLKRGMDFVEVMCGCTSHRYGDAVGRLRVFASGDLEIDCECTPGCQEEKLSPAAFEKHSGRETARKWKSNVWVIVKGEKVSLSKTPLLKYYNQTSKANGSHKGSNGRPCHRDEFIFCSRCKKERRFRLRNKEECRIYHDALADQNWSCSDFPTEKISCDGDEERASRKVLRGCSRSPSCRGCTTCVCFGCETCRFTECSCQTCIDFTRNSEA